MRGFSFVIAFFTSLQALAIVPGLNPVIQDKAISDRSCIMEFISDDGMTEKLSGFLINSTRILSVGHTNYFKKKMNVICGVTGKKILLTKLRKRHPRYDYKDNPKTVAEWAKYDIAVVDIKAGYAPSVQPIGIISDMNEVKTLIQQGRCIWGGSGEKEANSLRNLKFIYVNTPVTPGVHSDTHATVKYPGAAQVVLGDSGGPLLCRRADNVLYLSGLLNYGGVIKNNTTGKTENLVAVLILRPELLNEFVFSVR